MSHRKWTKVMNEYQRQQLYTINRILNNYPGFGELSTEQRHLLKMDILGRYELNWASPFSLDQFVHNYRKWVETYLSAKHTEPIAMWEDWCVMLKQLYFGL